MCWELQLRVQQCRAYIKCPRCQGEWQRWLKARQELLSAPGRVTALLITESILVTSDMGIQSFCFGEFYLFRPREDRWAASWGSSLLLWQLDKLIHAGSSGGWNFLHSLSFLYLFFSPAGLYCRKDKKKSIGIAKESSSGAVPWMLQPFVKLFHEGQWVMEVCSFVSTAVHQCVRKRDCTAPSLSLLPRKTLQRPNQEI